jgi:hypothetical protein
MPLPFLAHAFVVILVFQLVSVPGDMNFASSSIPLTSRATLSASGAFSHPLSIVADHGGSQPVVGFGDIDDPDDDDDDDFAVATVLVAQMPTLRAAVSIRGAAPRLDQPITLNEPPPDPPPTSVG